MTESDDARGAAAPEVELGSVLKREAALRERMSEAALARYAVRVRRQRLIYYPVAGTVLLALVLAFVIAYLHGEAHNTRLITVARAPAPLSVQMPAVVQREIWHTADRTAVGNPRSGGTIVVWSGRTVRGINARTGRQTWSYYRSDRTVCSAAQIHGTTIAIYELAGNCDELTALNSGTGARQWTRTLDFNGLPLNGHPTVQADEADAAIVITTAAEIYSIRAKPPLRGVDSFTYSHFGCRINRAVLGSTGALINQSCTHPRCKGLNFCGAGIQLLLRGEPESDVSDTNTKNPNMIQWNNLDDNDDPISAGTPITAGNTTTGDLDTLDPNTGKPAGSVSLGVAGSAWATATATALSDGDLLVQVGGRLAVLNDEAKLLWTTSSPGHASAAGSTITAPATGGVRVLSSATGETTSRYALTPSPTRGSTVYRLGPGFLVASGSGTTAYK